MKQQPWERQMERDHERYVQDVLDDAVRCNVDVGTFEDVLDRESPYLHPSWVAKQLCVEMR